jgi:hypothetical protein
VRRDEPKTVLVPEDHTGRVLNRLIVAGMALVSGLSLVGGWLMLAGGELLAAGSLSGIGLFFAWLIDQKSIEPEHSLSRRLSHGSLQGRRSTPNTRLEPTRDHDGQSN